MRDRTSDLDPSVARWLVDDGLVHVGSATAALDGGASLLELGTRLRRDGLSPERAAAVAETAVARQRARDRWSDADALLFTREGLEQASDPAVSRWRARRFAGADRVVDVAAGVGGDTVALARVAEHVTAVDHDESRAILLIHNARVAGVDPSVLVADARRLPVQGQDLLHADPARRRGSTRARSLADYQPSLPDLGPALARVRGAGIVVSPGVALDDPELPGGELEFIQVGAQLTEAVCWTGGLARESRRSATVIGAGRVWHRGDNGSRPERLPVGQVGEWLVEMAPAAVRARIHDLLGDELDGWRLAEDRALITTDRPPGPSPWWRAGRVEAVLPLRPRSLKDWLRGRDVVSIEFVVHGLDVHLERWWREAGSPPRAWGDRVVHLIRAGRANVCVVTDAPMPAQMDVEGRGELVPGSEVER